MSALAGAAANGRDGTQPLTVANLLQQYTPGYVTQFPGPAVPQVQSTLAKLSLCRTAALGGRLLACESCERQCVVYNSCGDRHCPQCSGAKRADWLERTRTLLLPSVNYFQVVFTLPQQLSSLALGHRRVMYDLLFQTAWQALREVIQQKCQFQPAAVLVLHT